MYNRQYQDESDSGGSVDGDRGSGFGSRQLIVVSNRQPYRHERSEGGQVSVDRPTGGLTASLDPVMQRTGGTWVAWGDGDADREAVGAANSVAVPPDDPAYTLRRIWLTEDQVRGYYYGFSNQVLWPVCHSSLATVQSEPGCWEQYRRTNEQFADAVAAEAGASPTVWLQDYHLALAPRLVRQRLGPRALLVQFWHIPWPSWDVYRACPHGDELLRGLLGNDTLAFHVDRYRTNFLECVDRALEDATVDRQSGDVSSRDGTTRVEAIPMGVPFDEIARDAASQDGGDFASFRDAHGIDGDTRIAVGVDRLDYTKGIPERLRALERLWERYPRWRGSLTYVQNGTESRSGIRAYRAIQERVHELVDRINDRFGTDDWTPVVRVDEHLDQSELYGLYRHADLGLVSPIRDGLNLVAQEYAAAQVDADGVLVLSTQTGAHDLLGEAAVSIQPFDVEGFADRLHEALTLSPSERRSRMETIRRTVAANDLESWLRKNASAAEAAARPRDRRLQHD